MVPVSIKPEEWLCYPQLLWATQLSAVETDSWEKTRAAMDAYREEHDIFTAGLWNARGGFSLHVSVIDWPSYCGNETPHKSYCLRHCY